MKESGRRPRQQSSRERCGNGGALECVTIAGRDVVQWPRILRTTRVSATAKRPRWSDATARSIGCAGRFSTAARASPRSSAQPITAAGELRQWIPVRAFLAATGEAGARDQGSLADAREAKRHRASAAPAITTLSRSVFVPDDGRYFRSTHPPRLGGSNGGSRRSRLHR